MNEQIEEFVAAQMARIEDRRRGCTPSEDGDAPARFPGTLKVEPEDFVVEEIPAYEPSGEGEHIFLWIEKRNRSSTELMQHLEQRLRASRFEIGTAGMKDKRAVTRQWVSVPARCGPDVRRIDTREIRVLRESRHGNKLKTGHLRGNRFEIVVRDVPESALTTAETIAARLRDDGMPNYYGAQRFGNGGETLRLGFELLTGTKTKKDVPSKKRRFLVRLAISAAQSTLFNECLERRLVAGHLRTVFDGDALQKADSGAPFLARSAAEEQPRLDAGGIVLTGPMFGHRMLWPKGEPGERERELLMESGLVVENFAHFNKLATGTRRPYVVPLGSLEIEPVDATSLRFRFDLPSGVYATEALAEFIDAPGELRG